MGNYMGKKGFPMGPITNRLIWMELFFSFGAIKDTTQECFLGAVVLHR